MGEALSGGFASFQQALGQAVEKLRGDVSTGIQLGLILEAAQADATALQKQAALEEAKKLAQWALVLGGLWMVVFAGKRRK